MHVLEGKISAEGREDTVIARANQTTFCGADFSSFPLYLVEVTLILKVIIFVRISPESARTHRDLNDALARFWRIFMKMSAAVWIGTQKWDPFFPPNFDRRSPWKASPAIKKRITLLTICYLIMLSESKVLAVSFSSRNPWKMGIFGTLNMGAEREKVRFFNYGILYDSCSQKLYRIVAVLFLFWVADIDQSSDS